MPTMGQCWLYVGSHCMTASSFVCQSWANGGVLTLDQYNAIHWDQTNNGPVFCHANVGPVLDQATGCHGWTNTGPLYITMLAQ